MHILTPLYLRNLSTAMAWFLLASNVSPVPGAHVRVHSTYDVMSQRYFKDTECDDIWSQTLEHPAHLRHQNTYNWTEYEKHCYNQTILHIAEKFELRFLLILEKRMSPTYQYKCCRRPWPQQIKYFSISINKI
jgi:hypothetical protein